MVLTSLIATHAYILTSILSTGSRESSFSVYGTLPYHSNNVGVRGFGTMFSPDTFSARDNLTSELLRFL